MGKNRAVERGREMVLGIIDIPGLLGMVQTGVIPAFFNFLYQPKSALRAKCASVVVGDYILAQSADSNVAEQGKSL